MADNALSASKRIVDACKQLLATDAYRSARQSILIAEVGIYALAKGAKRVFTEAMKQYREMRTQFKERYPDLRFVGDFESAEDDLLEGRTDLLLDSHRQKFRSTVRWEHIHLFFQLLDQVDQAATE